MSHIILYVFKKWESKISISWSSQSQAVATAGRPNTLRQSHSYEHHVIIKYCLSGCEWQFSGCNSNGVFTSNKVICGRAQFRFFLCDAMHLWFMACIGIWLVLQIPWQLMSRIQYKSAGWMNGLTRGAFVRNLTSTDHTGLGGKTEAAQHKARQRKLPLSASVSATVLVQQMIHWMSHRNGQMKRDLYLSHSLRP